MRPIAIGGDHSITLPLLRAAHAKYGKLAVVHFDAHCDVSDTQFGAPYHYGSAFRRAVEEGIVLPDRMVQIGIRKHYHPGEIRYLAEHGIERITSRDLKRMGPELREVLSDRLRRLAGAPVYVTFDLDFIDAASAPGIGSPEPFGPTSFEAVEALRAVSVISDRIVAMDLVELSPLHDVANLTAYLAAQILFEMVCILPPTVRALRDPA
jgi:agmatinase